MTEQAVKVEEITPLELATKEELTKELVLVKKEDQTVTLTDDISNDPEIIRKAQEFVEKLLDPKVERTQKREAVDNLGARTSEKARQYSAMLAQPV